MRKTRVMAHDIEADILEELKNNQYCFTYHTEYQSPPVSLTMPIQNKIYKFNRFPPFFDGLLPEGEKLEALLRIYKLDKHDYFGQLLQCNPHFVGAVTIDGLNNLSHKRQKPRNMNAMPSQQL